jgi:CDGSH-type Zn-finger protein
MSEITSATAKLTENGPLNIKGSLTIKHSGEEHEMKNVFLCRCGASENKPFCDGAHKTCGYEGSANLGEHQLAAGENSEAGPLEIVASNKGPLVVTGPITFHDGDQTFNSSKLFLCRCGASTNAPFCDGSHKSIGFEAS